MTPAQPPLTALAIALALAAPAAAQEARQEIVNASPLTVMELYSAPAGTAAFGGDILGARVIAPGDSALVTIAEGAGECLYDLLFVLEDGQEQTQRIDICAADSHSLGR
jgi:hypothetical protein